MTLQEPRSSSPFDRLLYRESALGDTGALNAMLGAQAVVVLGLERGWVHVLGGDLGELAAPRAEETLLRVLERAPHDAAFDSSEKLPRAGRVTPFHPAATLRRHFEAQLADDAGHALRERLGDGRVRLALPTHASCLDPDERRVVGLLAVPCRVTDLERASGTSRPRIERLLAFLERAGALDPASDDSPYRLLGLPEGAPAGEVRRTYRQLVRALHPDLHTNLPADERRAMEDRLRALGEAYRQLTNKRP